MYVAGSRSQIIQHPPGATDGIESTIELQIIHARAEGQDKKQKEKNKILSPAPPRRAQPSSALLMPASAHCVRLASASLVCVVLEDPSRLSLELSKDKAGCPHTQMILLLQLVLERRSHHQARWQGLISITVCLRASWN